MIIIDNKFTWGDIVYHKTDKEQAPRIITSIAPTLNNAGIRYCTSYGGIELWCNEMELTPEPNIALSMGVAVKEKE